MKRTLIRIGIIYITVNLLLAAVFFSAGGGKMLARPSLPDVPSDPVLASDLEYFREVVLQNEVSVTDQQIDEFNRILDSAPRPRTVDDLTLLTSRALAVFDNAHTTLLRPLMRRLPVRFHWTADALVIVKARGNEAPLLGNRVLSFGGRTPESLLVQMDSLVGGGTQNWRRYRSEYFFSAPAALEYLGAEIHSNGIVLRTLSPEGEEREYLLQASEEPMPGDPFWDFRDSFPDDGHHDTADWLTALSADDSLPIYLQDVEQLHALRFLPEINSLYLRMNASFADGTESLKQFKQRALNLIEERSPRDIIIDFRHNRGGDYTQVLPIVRSISAALPEQGTLYVIVGPNTFSAGIIAATQFKRFVPDRLKVVGSQMGDGLRFKAEGFYPVLPYSGIRLYLTKAWTDLENGCSWFDDCWFPNKLLLRSVGSFEVDIHAENTWESYLEGRDAVLDALREDILRS